MLTQCLIILEFLFICSAALQEWVIPSVVTVATVTIVSFVIAVILWRCVRKSQPSYVEVVVDEPDANERRRPTAISVRIQENRGYGAVEASSGSFHIHRHLTPERVHIPEGSIPM